MRSQALYLPQKCRSADQALIFSHSCEIPCGLSSLIAQQWNTLNEKIKKENPNVLLLDADNINTGNAISNLFKAKPDVLGYNLIGYDAMAISHHDFDQGLEGLEMLAKLASFPFLTANIRTNNGKDIPFFHPYLIK